MREDNRTATVSAGAPVSAVVSRFELGVDACKAREMALALGARDPRWREATDTELVGVEVVPSYTAVAAFRQDRTALLADTLALDVPRTLHGEQAWTFHRRPVVGDRLQATTAVVGELTRRGRRGGRLRIVTLGTEYRELDGSVVLSEQWVVVQTEALPGAGAVPVATAPSSTTDTDPTTVPLAEAWTVGPLTRTHLVRYAGASGDFNPIHHDDVFAREQGLDEVFAMGMLQGGMLAVYLDDHRGDRELRSLRLRFNQQLWPGDHLRLSGELLPTASDSASCQLWAQDQHGAIIVSGRACLGG